MKLLIQRVKEAEVFVAGERIAAIKQGILAFLGVAVDDDGSQIEKLARKLAEIRIFADENDKMNLSVKDIGGSILLVSQFTLCADTARGRRPDFFTAAEPQKAKQLYEKFAAEVRKSGVEVKEGVFGAAMQISLINDGPVTLMLEM